MDEALAYQKNFVIQELSSRGVFCDGLKVAQPVSTGNLELQRSLQDSSFPVRFLKIVNRKALNLLGLRVMRMKSLGLSETSIRHMIL